MIVNVLHASTVGAGFIPVLPPTDMIQSKYHAVRRMGINPPIQRIGVHLTAIELHCTVAGAAFMAVRSVDRPNL